MSTTSPTLHLLCGKIAAGKSTLAAKLVENDHAVLISEDEWLSVLYPDEMQSISDYVQYSARLKAIMSNHVTALLSAGLSIVLDFPANTLKQRRWMLAIIEKANVPHQLHYLDTPDEVCLARLHARNAEGEHPFAATDEEFFQVSSHFVPPTTEEGFNIVVHRP